MRYIKELAVCVVVILAIIEFDIIFENHFRTQKNQIENCITELEERLASGEIDEEKSKELYNKWFKFESKASYYIEHDELEKVSIKISLAKKAIEIEEIEEAQNDLEEVRFLINHIYEKDKLKLKNIF